MLTRQDIDLCFKNIKLIKQAFNIGGTKHVNEINNFVQLQNQSYIQGSFALCKFTTFNKQKFQNSILMKYTYLKLFTEICVASRSDFHFENQSHAKF